MGALYQKRVPSDGEFSVVRLMVDGKINVVCSEVSAVHAAQEFQRCCNNVSAITWHW